VLRVTLIGLSIAAFIVAIALTLTRVGGNTPLAIWVAVQAMIVVVALLAERGRYHPTLSSQTGFIPTNERFRDPTTGEWTMVEFNPSAAIGR